MRLVAMVAALTLAVAAPGFIGGVPDERWDNDALHQLRRVTLANPEATPTPAARADADRGPERAGLVPQLLTVVLALTATALATRAVRRTRHGPPDRASSPRR